MTFGLLDGREDGDHNGVPFVKIYKIFVAWYTINSNDKKANFSRDGVIIVTFGSLDGREDGDRNGVSFVKISKIFVA